MTPNQQAQLRQGQQARQAGKPAMQAELEQIIVYQAAKMRDIEQELIQANTTALQLQAVLQNSEQVAQQRAEEVQRLSGDLEAVRQFLAVTAIDASMPMDELVKVAREHAALPKAAEVVMDASPAPAPETPAEVPA